MDAVTIESRMSVILLMNLGDYKAIAITPDVLRIDHVEIFGEVVRDDGLVPNDPGTQRISWGEPRAIPVHYQRFGSCPDMPDNVRNLERLGG